MGLAIVTLLGLTATANEKPPADFQQAMKDNGAALQKLGKDVEAKDYDAVASGAATFKKNFMGPVGKYFTDHKMEDALKKCTEAYTAADNLEKAAKAKNDTELAESRTALQRSCGSCHTAHREQLPDKTYEIK
jgi:cytochrome c556